MSTIHSDEFRRPRKVLLGGSTRRSRLAIWALVCSLMVICPLAPLAAVILGLCALRVIADNTALKGKTMAASAVAIGLLFSVCQGIAGYVGYHYAEQARHGPSIALRAGFDGDIDRFLDAFHPTDVPLNRRDAEAFLSEVRSRYGNFVDGQIATPSGRLDFLSDPGRPRVYRLDFKNGSAMAEASIVLFDTPEHAFISNRLGYLSIDDPVRGKVTFPAPTQVVDHP